MKITASADWRDAIPFETPVLVSEFVPGEDTRCSECGVESDPRPRTELWAVKHHHPNQHAGFVRFYCLDHRPAVAPAPAPIAAAPVRAKRAPAVRAERVAPAKRPPLAIDRVRAMCPECYVEVSAKGLCGVCGNSIAI